MFNKTKLKARGSSSSFEYPPPMSAEVYLRNGVAYKPIDVPSREEPFPHASNRNNGSQLGTRSTRRHTNTSRPSHTHSCSDGRHSLNSSGSRMSHTSSETSNTVSRHHSRASFRTRVNTPSESQSNPKTVPDEVPPAHSKTSNPPAGYLRTINPYNNTQMQEKGAQLMRIYIPSLNDPEWEAKWMPGRKVKVLCPDKGIRYTKVPPRSHWQNDEHNALSYFFKVEYNPTSQKELACTSCAPSLRVYDSSCPIHGTSCNPSDNLNEAEDDVSVAQQDVNMSNPLDRINTTVQSSGRRKKWECKACSLMNDEERVACEVCWTIRNQYCHITGI